LGILPTILIFIGLALLIRQGFLLLFTWQKHFGTEDFWSNLFKGVCVVLLLGSVATMFTGVLKYNDWAFMHTRLLVHVFYPIVLLLATGLSFLKKRYPDLLKFAAFNMAFLAVLTIFYFSVESSVLLYNWLEYGDKDEIQWYVNKSLGL
jgi:cation transport ATPase